MATKTNPYTYFGMTVSVCPECHRSVPANLLERDNKVYLSKTCPDHGRVMTIIASDAEWYHAAQKYTSPTHMLRKYQTKTTSGCPQDCGVCPEHQQDNSVPVIEITNVCNLDCPVCFAQNAHDYYMSAEEMERCLDTLEASGTNVDVLVLTGGEPTAHPQLVELVEQCYRRASVPRVAIATNGILIGKRHELAERLVAAEAYIMLQLDSLDAEKNKVMRGKDMIRYRERALEVLERLGAQTSLIMTVIAGLNDDEIGSLFKFTLRYPFIRGFEIQTMSYTGSGGRNMKFDPMRRITGTDLIHAIDTQSDGIVRRDDFIPMPHPHPNCVAICYLLRLNDDSYVPFPRFTPRETYLAALTSHFVATPDQRYEGFIQGIIDHVYANVDSIERGPDILAALRSMLLAVYPEAGALTERQRLMTAESYVKNVFLHNYMDDYSLDAAVLRKCTSMQIIPDGRMIPNCGYRTIHRKTDPRWLGAGAPDMGHGLDGLRRQLHIIPS